MKKLLLLFLLSLGLIGSANANSIEGAFGYKLGEVFNSSVKGTYVHIFNPKKRLSAFNRYSISTTVTDKKIGYISALTRDENYSVNSEYCTPMPSSPHHKVLSLLQAKYGKFEKLFEQHKKYEWNNGEVHEIEYEFSDGDRTIYLKCETYTEVPNGKGTYILYLRYIDWILNRRATQEYDELRKNNLKDEAKDYDL